MVGPSSRLILTSLHALAILASPAFALEPAPIKVGPFDLTPTLETDVMHTDNMFLSSDNEQTSAFALVKPRLAATSSRGANTFSAIAEIHNGNYSATSEDDYTDWKVGAIAHLELGVRNIINLEAEYFDTHEVRGTGFSQGDFFTPVPDRFANKALAASYQFGADQSRGRIVLSAAAFSRDYTNNPLTTYFRSRDDRDLGGTFFLGVLPRTDFLIQYRHRNVDYVNDLESVDGVEDTLDSREDYAYAGVTWQATAKTSGSIKAGYGAKDFLDPDRSDTSGPSWEAQVRWEPLTYSRFDFSTGRIFGEQNGIGSGLDSRNFSINWEHGWSGKLKSGMSASHSSDTYMNSDRRDKVRSIAARMDYSVDTWLDLYVAIGHDNRQSVLDNFDYDQNTFRLGFAVGL